MDKDYFLNSGIHPPLHFEPSPILNNCSPEQSSDCFFNPSWDKFDSALSSMVSSPAASNSAISNDSFAIRELIGKLGNICNSGEISNHSHPLLAATAAFIGGGNMSANTSCYTTPLNSPPKLQFPIDHQVTDKMPHLGNSMPMNPNLPAVSADPGFAERAAKFSCFGSRSFNGRTSQLGLNNIESKYRSSQLMNSAKLQRVCSSPSLKVGGPPMVSAQEIKNSAQTQMGMRSTETKFSKVSGSAASDRTELASSNEGSSVSEQIPNREIGLKIPSESNSRKRKAVSRGKSSVNATKGQEEDDPNLKRSKSTEANEEMKGTSDGEGDEGKKQAKSNSKPPEPPRDYIHVRARRGQATDSHSLAERVRREKIGERMKLLQDLVPGCNKVTGKALMLDEIINYVQSLQRQVEFLSMKLASVNSLDFNMDNLLSKDVFQSNPSLPHQAYPLESSASAAFFGHHNTHEISQLQTKFSNGAVTQCSVDPIGTTTLCRNIGIHQLPPPTDEFCQGLPQFPTLCEDDLQSIVQMGFHSQNFPGSSQPSHMKIEL